ncbi:PadR family transcriptional regulator [Yinghuangia seranimata]|uniref:PadR family transcriptional regulator n=1 Tax=Yinghuangia seranimata TaxID=408067 RepID=UPI00248C4DA1|nr:PadR family transcriptional regulator [Yinghuangia seranimata]MDI2129746.1 PadR family transcriptional regulator [Yinghuangia seranimata]
MNGNMKRRPKWGEREGRRPAYGPWGPGHGPGPGFGPGFGPEFGREFGRGHGRGPRGPRGGRARRGDVRASILALLNERPMHGYEMIREIGERTQGVWKPSPGSVYPTLQLLEDEGVVVGEESGGKKLFSLTDAGREEVARQPEGTAPWDQASEGVDHEALHNLRQSVFQVGDALRQVMATGNETQRAKALEVMADTRKRLYLILAEAE